MDCRDCNRFNENTGRCMDGKVNPKTYEQAFNVSQLMGLRSICVFNDYREHLVTTQRMPQRGLYRR